MAAPGYSLASIWRKYWPNDQRANNLDYLPAQGGLPLWHGERVEITGSVARYALRYVVSAQHTQERKLRERLDERPDLIAIDVAVGAPGTSIRFLLRTRLRPGDRMRGRSVPGAGGSRTP